MFRSVYLTYVLVLMWVGVKAFWWFQFDVSPLEAPNEEAVWRYYYPELWKSGAMDSRQDPDSFQVLLLGGSVLDQAADHLEPALKQSVSENLRLYNASSSAHTSRDSYLKYQNLADKRFDLIVIYHGINDVRMNCCQAEYFREDYTHCNWYNQMQRRLADDPLSIQHLLLDHMISLCEPPPDMMKFGGTIKTREAFRKNLQAIVEHAGESGTSVVLMTFAYHVPKNYTLKRFKSGKLDYGKGHYQLPVEMWGEPEHVVAAVEAHNDVIRQLAGEHDHVIFVDMQALLPRDGEHFSDLCHLTEAGDQVLVKTLASAVSAARGGSLFAYRETLRPGPELTTPRR